MSDQVVAFTDNSPDVSSQTQTNETLNHVSVNPTQTLVAVDSSNVAPEIVSPPILKNIPDQIYPQKALLPGVPFVVDFNNIQKGEPGEDNGMTYNCTIYPQSNLGISYPCEGADGVKFDLQSGVLSVIPQLQSVGTYKVKISGQNSGGIAFSQFYVSVREPYSQLNLMVDLDARFSGLFMPALGNFTNWVNLADVTRDAKIIGTPRWNGDGSRINPFRQDFNQASNVNHLSLGTFASAKSRLAFTLLGSVSSPSSQGSVIAGTISKNSTGWAIRQSDTKPRKVELVAGQSFQDIVQSLAPVAYWRLNEEKGETTAKDISGNANHGAISGPVSVGGSGFIPNDLVAKSVWYDYHGKVVAPASSTLNTANSISISVWFRPNANGNGYQPLVEYGDAGNIGVHLWQYSNMKMAYANFRDANRGDHALYVENYNSFPIVQDQWNHVVAVYDGSFASIYVNGKKATSKYLGSFSLATRDNLQIGYRLNASCWWWSSCPYRGDMGDVAIFKQALSDTDVTRMHNALLGKSGSTCITKSSVPENQMLSLAGIVNPAETLSGLKLLMNGKEECSTGIAMPASQIVSTNPLTLAADSSGEKRWSGSLSDFKLYGSDLFPLNAEADLNLIHSLFQARTR